jgi:hypothetical protein
MPLKSKTTLLEGKKKQKRNFQNLCLVMHHNSSLRLKRMEIPNYAPPVILEGHQ